MKERELTEVGEWAIIILSLLFGCAVGFGTESFLLGGAALLASGSFLHVIVEIWYRLDYLIQMNKKILKEIERLKNKENG